MSLLITLAAIGKDKNSPAEQWVQEYSKRLPWKLELQVNDGRKLKNKSEETLWLLEACAGADVIWALDEKGRDFTSIEFADMCREHIAQGVKHMAFMIGGATGLDKSLLPKHCKHLCFGRMTWPHQMVRAMLAEQLYRASTIISGHPYHRE